MIFEHLLKTGESTIAGSQLVADINNRESRIADGFFTIREDYVTGAFSSIGSVNSQTLVEGMFTKTTLPFETIYDTSGDYFVDEAEFEISSVARMDKDFPILSPEFSNIIYEKRPRSNTAIFIASATGQVSTGLMATIATTMPTKTGSLNSLMYFGNGQKLYSGDSYFISGNNNIFFYKGNFTGKFFAIENPSGFMFRTGIYKDSTGVSFIESNNNIYYAGMEQNKDMFLELNSGVNLIAPNVVSKLILNNPDNLQINL
jgi:hypothetical protein